ncbi:hypothetical protein BELL_0275g00120 [Botrytis elliptica]|uniref:DUF659 domain-containing protein n=1 Tax=Botrytis elliptica TaxID=278938 RepID=A0A4Z1JZZ0_9HELO|nr:hypothetical protein EAE99_005663 [Botrytis elliptica]TGO74527.1 hypothetical protein BELL_0275g00120 [Botrytis elliptica]
MTKSWNTTQFQSRHIERCSEYLSWKAKQPRTTAPLTDFFKNDDIPAEILFAEAIFTSTSNLSFYETPEWEAFFQRVKFTPPSRKVLSNKLLDTTYLSVKKQVSALADAASRIQFISDGSANIMKTRVENVSFMIGAQSFYWRSTAIDDGPQDAEFTLNHVAAAAREVTKGDLSKWHAFSSDTCSTQRKCWALMRDNPELKHIHSIPCDSHGLQLIFKDLLFPGKNQYGASIETVLGFFFKEANDIIVHFTKSSKELSLLRSIMVLNYKKIFALIKTVPTRWGTQVHMLESIQRVQLALQNYARHPNAVYQLDHILSNIMFWQKL